MLRKITTLILISLCASLHAQTCPRVKDIHNNHTAGWQAYDIYGVKMTEAQTKKFREHALEFALAEAIPTSKNTIAIRCLYRDKSGANMQGYLAKNNILADNSENYWYEVSGRKHCAAGVKLCQFVPNVLHNRQFAKK